VSSSLFICGLVDKDFNFWEKTGLHVYVREDSVRLENADVLGSSTLAQ
jgi:hypothetical protein